MPTIQDGPVITGASKASIDAALADEPRLISFPDSIDRIMILPAGIWVSLERFHAGRGLPMSRFSEAVFWLANNGKENQHLDFEARLRRIFKGYSGYLAGQSVNPRVKPANR